MKGLVRGKALRLSLALVLTMGLVVGIAAEAHAIPIIILFQFVTGTVKDAGTTARVPGIVVSAFDASTGQYEGSTVTGSDGTFSIFEFAGSYKLQFRDPTGKYGEQWSYNQANMTDSTAIDLSTGVNTDTGDIQLRQAGTIKAIVRRSGHPLTKLPGSFLILQQKSGSNTYQQWSGTAGADGSASWSGLRTYNVTYAENAIDPTGRFYSSAVTAFNPLVGGTVYTQYIDLNPAGASREITPTVPTSSKTSRSANVKFTVTGSFTKAIANGSQIKILAVKSSGATKSFAGKIKSGGYSASVKLAKGTWKLYALFSGNATFAANDSLNGRTFKVK